MYETNRPITDRADVYAVTPVAGNLDESLGEDDIDTEEWGYNGESGQVFPILPKKKSKGKNSPGAAESERRGALANFRSAPNSTYGAKGEAMGGKRAVFEMWWPESLSSRFPASVEGSVRAGNHGKRKRPPRRKRGAKCLLNQ